MKRKLLLSLVAAAVGSAFALSALPDPSIDYHLFQFRFFNAIHRANLRDLTPTKLDDANKFPPEEVSIPWSIRWNPRRWYPRTVSTVPPFFGNTDGNFQWTHRLGNGSSSPFVCTVVYLDGRVSFVHIQAQIDSSAAVESLQSMLNLEFPGLPIKVEVRDENIRG